MELVVVHGALVRDGAWWWGATAELLRARTGIRSRALALPSCGETTAGEMAGGLVADAAALRRALDGIDDGQAIVVGHSYGGTVIAEAGPHAAVAHLVLISSYLPDVGQAQALILGGEADPVTLENAGDVALRLAGLDAASFGARFLQDADPATQQQAWARVTRQAAGAFVTPTTAAAGAASTPRTWCARTTSVELQRAHAARATRAVELPTGHHPFVTRPDLVVDAIAALPRG